MAHRTRRSIRGHIANLSCGALVATAAVVAAPASAQTVFSEDFSGANAGTQASNARIAGSKFSSFGPNVDIVGETANGGHFFDCIGNPGGACVDLVGGQGAGGTITSDPFALVAGTSYTIRYSDILQGFNAGDPQTSDYTVSLGGFSTGLTSLAGIVTTRALTFVAGASDPLAVLSFTTTTAPDGVHGPVLQNISVTGTAASSGVPEPAGWAMMIGGFGVVGGAMRRRAARFRFA